LQQGSTGNLASVKFEQAVRLSETPARDLPELVEAVGWLQDVNLLSTNLSKCVENDSADLV